MVAMSLLTIVSGINGNIAVVISGVVAASSAATMFMVHFVEAVAGEAAGEDAQVTPDDQVKG